MNCPVHVSVAMIPDATVNGPKPKRGHWKKHGRAITISVKTVNRDCVNLPGVRFRCPVPGCTRVTAAHEK